MATPLHLLVARELTAKCQDCGWFGGSATYPGALMLADWHKSQRVSDHRVSIVASK